MTFIIRLKRIGKKASLLKMVLKKKRNIFWFKSSPAGTYSPDNIPLISPECFLKVEFLVHTNSENFRLFLGFILFTDIKYVLREGKGRNALTSCLYVFHSDI